MATFPCKAKKDLNIELSNDRTVVALTYADCTCTARYPRIRSQQEAKTLRRYFPYTAHFPYRESGCDVISCR